MEALEALFRRERAPIVAALYRLGGSLDAAEEAFQDAVVQALALWPKQGQPDRPGAWLGVVAKNQLLQGHRQRGLQASKSLLLPDPELGSAPGPESGAGALADDMLRLIFVCCHPELAQEAQVALTLRVVSGLTTEEIARAFLSPEATVAQRIVRAKRTIEERKLAYAVPGRRDLGARISSVLAVVYLIFNEGHTAHSGGLMRIDLQHEALRLSQLLGDLLPTEPDVFGLQAIIAFGVARAETRVDAEGGLLLLSEQDRTRWNRSLIVEGLVALQHARGLDGGGGYVLQAEIAACHATAPEWAATNWSRILRAYDALLELNASPVVALNRAVAVAMRDGPEAGLQALSGIEEALRDYAPFYATRADLRRRCQEDPHSDYQRALELTRNTSERRFLERRLREIGPA